MTKSLYLKEEAMPLYTEMEEPKVGDTSWGYMMQIQKSIQSKFKDNKPKEAL